MYFIILTYFVAASKPYASVTTFFYVPTSLIMKLLKWCRTSDVRRHMALLLARLIGTLLFDTILVLTSLKFDDFLQPGLSEICALTWVFFPFLAAISLLGIISFSIKFAAVVTCKPLVGPGIFFYIWSMFLSAGGTVMLFFIITEISSSSKSGFSYTKKLKSILLAAVIHVAVCLVLQIIARKSIE